MGPTVFYLQKDGKGFFYGVFRDEFFKAVFESYSGSLSEAAESVQNGADPDTLPHQELTRFPLRELTEIRVYQGWTHMDVCHRGSDGKAKEETLYFGKTDLDATGRELAQATGMPFRETERAAGFFSLFIFPGLTLALGGFIVSLLYLAAKDPMENGEFNVRGRLGLLRAIFVAIGSVMGMAGCLVLAALLILGCAVWIARNIMFWPQNRHFEFPQA